MGLKPVLDEAARLTRPGRPHIASIREMINKALVEMDELFALMCEADIKGGHPSLAPERLTCSVRKGFALEQGIFQTAKRVRAHSLDGAHSRDHASVHQSFPPA